jgi:hypothetical protein
MLTAKVTGAILLAILICAALPTMLLVNGQTNQRTEEVMVTLAEQASNQIQTLIASVYADENVMAKIENKSLTEQFQGNVTLFQNEGPSKLAAAKEALENFDYNLASEKALDVLALYRQIYGSLQSILASVGQEETSNLITQTLTDAVTRELQRIETLRILLPANASSEIFTLVSETNSTLVQAKVAIQSNQTETAEQLYASAKQKIALIYQHLKTQAEESNGWRLNQYCETLQQRIEERFTYGNQKGVDFTSALASLGYSSQSAFMQALQNKIHSAQSKGNIQDAINECLSISQIVQQTEQTLDQEINRQQQGQPSPSNNGSGGSSTAPPTTGGNSTSSGSGNSGNGGIGGSENGSGGNNK